MAIDDHPEDWQPWIDRACRAVGVDPATVHTFEVLALTKTVAHRLPRPLAPVAAHILGLAVAAHRDADIGRLVDDLEKTLPPPMDHGSPAREGMGRDVPAVAGLGAPAPGTGTGAAHSAPGPVEDTP